MKPPEQFLPMLVFLLMHGDVIHMTDLWKCGSRGAHFPKYLIFDFFLIFFPWSGRLEHDIQGVSRLTSGSPSRGAPPKIGSARTLGRWPYATRPPKWHVLRPILVTRGMKWAINPCVDLFKPYTYFLLKKYYNTIKKTIVFLKIISIFFLFFSLLCV